MLHVTHKNAIRGTHMCQKRYNIYYYYKIESMDIPNWKKMCVAAVEVL